MTEWITTRTDNGDLKEHASYADALAYARQLFADTGHPVNVWALETFVDELPPHAGEG